MKKIGIVGCGYVGQRLKRFFEYGNHYEVKIYDPSEKISNSKEEINQCELGVVCVPTPMKKDKSCDTSIVEESVAWLKTPVIWIRSTIAPGTTEYLKKTYKKRIVFSPEYLGVGSYWTPYQFHEKEEEIPYVILGGDRKDTQYVINIIAPIMGPVKKYHQTDSTTAEVVKYMENTFFGVKVTFVNEMYEICQVLGVDFYEVRDLWLCDPRINPMHTMVFKEARGFAGKCLPKDINGIVQASIKAGYTPELLIQVLKSNEKFRKKNKKKKE
jgi:UDPglucose 6-dehydrogenase